MWQNNIHRLWKSIQEARPDSTFFEFFDPASGNLSSKTYSDLINDLVQLDFKFSSLSELRIMILMEKSYESFLVILFCLLKSHCFIPVQPKSKNIEAVANTTLPNYIISQTAMPNLINSSSMLLIADLLRDKTLSLAEFTPAPIEPDQIAYIISTSGTTGAPKLIPISNRNFDAYVNSISDKIKSPLPFTLVQNFEISFDPYLLDLIMVVLNKSSFLPVSSASVRHLDSIFKALASRSVWTSLTPTQADLILSVSARKPLPNIEKTFFLGEKLKRTLCLNWGKVFPNSKIYNLYGPAEVTISISYHEFNSVEDTGNFVPIGPIHPNHDFRISPEGELSIRGPQVFGGYFSSSNQTTGKGDWYNTGDLVEIVDSKIFIVGRSDLQIKINGRRFEPQEIEIELENHGIRGFVVPQSDEAIQKSKTKLIFVTDQKSVSATAIYELLITTNDPEFIPKQVFLVDEFPMSQNGKVDRKMLSALVASRT